MGTIYQSIGRQERDRIYIPQQEANYEAAKQQIATDGLPKEGYTSIYVNGKHFRTLPEADGFDQVTDYMAYSQTLFHLILEILPGARIPEKPEE